MRQHAKGGRGRQSAAINSERQDKIRRPGSALVEAIALTTDGGDAMTVAQPASQPADLDIDGAITAAGRCAGQTDGQLVTVYHGTAAGQQRQ